MTVRNHAPPSIPGPRFIAIGCGALVLVGVGLAAVYDQTFNVVHFELHNTSNDALWSVAVEQGGRNLARRQILNGGGTWSTTLRPADEAAIVLRFDRPGAATQSVVVNVYPSVSSTELLRVDYDGTSVTEERVVGWKRWF